jgi:predicted CxxxxCH...CXXCH cytochrome family protein
MAARSPGRFPRPLILLVLLSSVALGGCSPSSETGVGFLDAAGNHPAGFVTTHPAFARPDGSACVSCHGGDLQGGISGVSCFAASRDGISCHAFGPAFHPSGWPAPAVHGPAAKTAPGGTNGFAYCRICHGALFEGGAVQVACFDCHGIEAPHPRRPWRAAGPANTHTNVDAGNAAVCALCHTLGADSTRQPVPPAPPGTEPGCFNDTLCHGQPGTAPHAVRPYDAHPREARTHFDTFCSGCHSMNLPRRNASAPACTECHPGGNPLTVGNCASCHASPPDGAAPVGSVFPNVPGAHAAHDALPEVTGNCGVCHTGAGTGTGLSHFYDGAVGVSFAGADYQAQAGAVSFTAADGSCANVSCHGGIRTPGWRTGTIDGNTDAGCLRCHRKGSAPGVPESNSYFSGRHDGHERAGIGCTECHDMTLDTPGARNHFTFLSTPEMEGPASDTFRNEGVIYRPGPPGTGKCTGICHGRFHLNRPW